MYHITILRDVIIVENSLPNMIKLTLTSGKLNFQRDWIHRFFKTNREMLQLQERGEKYHRFPLLKKRKIILDFSPYRSSNR